MLPRGLDPWRHAAARLPLGRNEKLFLEITGDSPFVPETRVLGNPRDRRTGVYYIRPFGWPVIECFMGDEGARMVEEMGPAAGFAHATDQLAALFGSSVRRNLHPLVASNWGRMTHTGGAYSHALPGHAAARKDLALPGHLRTWVISRTRRKPDARSTSAEVEDCWCWLAFSTTSCQINTPDAERAAVRTLHARFAAGAVAHFLDWARNAKKAKIAVTIAPTARTPVKTAVSCVATWSDMTETYSGLQARATVLLAA